MNKMAKENTRILIFSDSLALARSSPDVCPHHLTWPELLKSDGLNIHQVSIGGATSTLLLGQVHYHLSYEPDYVILQVGIVDCVPRFMSKNELAIIRHIPVLGSKVISTMNNNRVRKFRGITYVSKLTFERNIANIVSYFKDKRVFILGIVPAVDEYELQVPGVRANIQTYNDILKKYGQFIPLDRVDRNCLMSDFHHLKEQGHQVIYEQIKERL
jgi:hypothetical protein